MENSTVSQTTGEGGGHIIHMVLTNMVYGKVFTSISFSYTCVFPQACRRPRYGKGNPNSEAEEIRFPGNNSADQFISQPWNSIFMRYMTRFHIYTITYGSRKENEKNK